MIARAYRFMWPCRLPQWGALAIGIFVALLICVDAAAFLLAFAGFWTIRANPALSFLFPRIKEIEATYALELSALGLLSLLGGATVAILFIYHGLACPFEIVVDPSDEAIHVRSMLGTVRVSAADIRRVKIGGPLDFSMYSLEVRHTGGKIVCINRFHNGDKLIDDIQALNSSIEIERIRGFRRMRIAPRRRS